MDTLLQLFPPNTPPDTFQPLSLPQYLSYIVTPYVICQLIGEDLTLTSIEEAREVMLRSADVRELINPECDGDEEVDLIQRKTRVVIKNHFQEGRSTWDVLEVSKQDTNVSVSVTCSIQEDSWGLLSLDG